MLPIVITVIDFVCLYILNLNFVIELLVCFVYVHNTLWYKLWIKNE